MTATTRNLYIEQGATFRFGFTWADGVVDADGNVTAGTPKNLTGWTFRMQIRKAQGTPSLISVTNTAANAQGSRILVGPPLGNDTGTPVLTNGRVVVKLTDEDTDLLDTKTAKYDLEAENSAGDVFRLWEGTVTVSPNITQEGGTEPVVGP